ncbi:MFS transporter [Leifsonia xyli]|uniref:MFS transporter n=1 Tax=Leifsonia xyli TaxID=1575 RepID=UPI0007CE0746|nr:MFS transporter [Leifsonia xyli]
MTTTATPVRSETDRPGITPGTARRVTIASFVGTALESYDFYLYAYFAAFFVGPLFFAPLGAFGGALAGFLAIAAGFVIRPVGAIVFGHLGDRIGRRPTLLITILIMGLSTGLVGVLPTYAAAGWFGAIAIVLLRLLQGFSVGGEWGGSILLATEYANPKKRGFYAALPQLGSPVGSILSAVVFIVLTLTLSTADIAAWGWRIPFLTAFPLLLVSLYLRWSIDETPVFRKLLESGKRDKFPVVDVFRKAPTGFIIGIGAAILGIGSYSLMNTYMVDYGTAVLGFKYQDLLVATTIGGLLQLVTIPLFGAWAARIGSAKVVAYGAIGTLIVAFPMYFLLQYANFGILVASMIIGGILPTLSWAALGGLMSDLFPSDVRYSGLSVAYSIAALLTSFVPALTLIFGHATGNAWWHPGIVLAVMSIITLVAALFAARRTPYVDEV